MGSERLKRSADREGCLTQRAHGQAHSTAKEKTVNVSLGKSRAVLHNAAGVQIASLREDEIACFEFRAKRGDVERFMKTKRGRPVLVFQLKESPLSADRRPRSDGHVRYGTPAALAKRDSEGIAGCGDVSRAQVERWAGWGLLRGRGPAATLGGRGN
jgi:hypothetical protein